MADASSIRKASSLAPESQAGAPFYKGAIRYNTSTNQVNYNSGTQWVPLGNVVLPVTIQAAAEAVDQTVFIADRPYVVASVTEVHSVIATGSFTAALNKATGTQAASAGAAVLTAAFDLNGVAANTVTTGTLNATAANYTLAVGDRLAFHFTGTATGLAGAVVTIVLQPL